MNDALPTTGLPGLRVVGLGADDETLLQAFFDANPGYFQAVKGESAAADEARQEIASEIPAGWPFTERMLLGWVAEDGGLAAMADVVSDLLATGVWHIGLFIVETARHGGGDAAALYGELEDWARRSGAAWMRLGVVEGNDRAQRFWTARGFVVLRSRGGYVMGSRTNVIRTMFKPLRGGSRDEYLALVARDRPERGVGAADARAQTLSNVAR